ncbi:MAG: type II secretion system protein N [Burkholderiaceae bacterium]|nr:type II secretion system protein N [Burkholderiaceae bacterium]
MRRTFASRWAESTHAEVAWGRSRASTARWGWVGALIGALIGAICFVPATWLAGAVSAATQQRFMLADARGTVWSGSAVAVLTGGPGSRDASALPGRLAWSVQPQGLALAIRLSQACCLDGSVGVLLKPAFGGFSAVLRPATGQIGQWPSDWLTGLGTPWNTLRLGGTVRLLSSGLALEYAQGHWRLAGGLNAELLGASSRLSTLETLGSYRLALQGEPLNASAATRPAGPADTARLMLSTLEGALLLSGNGTWGTNVLRFRGEAIARDAGDPALANLLNIIGRRDGARSVISIG